MVQKALERASKGDWLGILIVLRVGAGVSVLMCGQGLVWFETPASTKGESAQAILLPCPEVEHKGRVRVEASKVSAVKLRKLKSGSSL